MIVTYILTWHLLRFVNIITIALQLIIEQMFNK